MKSLQEVKLVQGGMGVYVSNWRLARAVAMERPGVTAGTVSGTGLDVVYVRLLQLGDPGGHLRRALGAFDAQFGSGIGQRLLDKYYIPGGKAPNARFKYMPLQITKAMDGSDVIPKAGTNGAAVPLKADPEMIELLIAANFAEVWLAKEGHDGNIFVNFMKKGELPLTYAMYGAMLAGVDAVVVGAGNPEGLPLMCTRLANHESVNIDLSVLYREAGESFYVTFDPKAIVGGKLTQKPLKRPAFLAIASLESLVEGLAQSPTQPPDGFIVEHHTAGGHNAGPQGPLVKDSKGQPIYGAQDEPNLAAIRAVGKPFWLAGGYGSRERFQWAQSMGAAGVQIGSNFALAEESGMKHTYRTAILDLLRKGATDEDLIHTTMFSPTGYPFKVVQLEGTVADDEVYNNRHRVCDLGFLQSRGLSAPDADGTRHLFQRCTAAEVNDFVKKRGLARNTEERRCLCNGLLSTVGLAQVIRQDGQLVEEPAIVTLGDHLDGIRRLSSNGQTRYWAKDAVIDIIGP